MKVLVTGAAGMLAAEILRKLSEEKHEIVQTDVNERTEPIKSLDVTDEEDVLRMIEEVRPDYVFHLAAETDVDLCEKKTGSCF